MTLYRSLTFSTEISNIEFPRSNGTHHYAHDATGGEVRGSVSLICNRECLIVYHVSNVMEVDPLAVLTVQTKANQQGDIWKNIYPTSSIQILNYGVWAFFIRSCLYVMTRRYMISYDKRSCYL